MMSQILLDRPRMSRESLSTLYDKIRSCVRRPGPTLLATAPVCSTIMTSCCCSCFLTSLLNEACVQQRKLSMKRPPLQKCATPPLSAHHGTGHR